MDDIKIKVIGFPGFLGQKDKRGELYGMAGDGKMDYTHKKTKMNKLITYKNIDTTGGQSGCPIFKDEEKSSEQDLYNSLNEIIGIHTAGKMSTGLNFGTPLNGELMQWIHEYIGCQNRKYDTYDIGVLLITSSQSKYADRLNNIYNTCLRTEIMDITRVYYEKDDNDIDTKKHFFSYVQQFFKEKKQKYLIFYCGESDDDGNWMINSNENDNYNATLEDIHDCIPDESKVILVSDCNYSGNWVTKFTQHTEQFSKIDVIQASSKSDAVCNAGVFTSKYAQGCFEYECGNVGTVKTTSLIAVSGISTMTMILYDVGFKQVYHYATKYSQPTSTSDDDYYEIASSRDGLYSIKMFFCNSWLCMDVEKTAHVTSGVATYGSVGRY
eukprot:237482_1